MQRVVQSALMTQLADVLILLLMLLFTEVGAMVTKALALRYGRILRPVNILDGL